MYLRTGCLGECTGISFTDSTALAVCRNPRVHTHKVFAGLVNDRGKNLQFCITSGNVDDRKPAPRLVKNLFGKLFGNKGYISQPLMQSLRDLFDIQLITKLRDNMKNQLMSLSDRILLLRRAIIETLIDQLKNIFQIEHSCHCSDTNFFVNVLCGLMAYCRCLSKPSLDLDEYLPLLA